jgi:hypothetical protein
LGKYERRLGKYERRLGKNERRLKKYERYFFVPRLGTKKRERHFSVSLSQYFAVCNIRHVTYRKIEKSACSYFGSSI